MQVRRLGRGLDSLLDIKEGEEQQGAESSDQVLMLPLAWVEANPDQPRREFNELELQELSQSIREKGILQPILVKKMAAERYLIIAGERRFRAAKLAGLAEVPALVREYGEEDVLEVALIENIQRSDLNALEEAKAYQVLMERFNLSQDELAKKVGKSRSAVANALRLLKLPKLVLDALAGNEISAGHARALLQVGEDAELVVSVYRAIVDQDMSVRAAESLARLLQSGTSLEDALQPAVQPSAKNSAEHESEQALERARELTRGAQMGASSGHSAVAQDQSAKRAPEIWDFEEKLIVGLGTKVQIKGDLAGGKIEITYYNKDDLIRLYELLIRQ